MLLVLYFALSVINLKFNRIQGTVRTVYTLNSLCVTVYATNLVRSRLQNLIISWKMIMKSMEICL